MIHADAKSLNTRGNRLFSAKKTLDSRNQELAENFYPARADFTVSRDMGSDFADHLVTGYPALVARDLGNSLGAMLRPKGKEWFHIKADREEKEDHEAKAWMEWATGVERRAMYDRRSNFTRATKEGDMDFANFGAAVISTEVNQRDMTLLYRTWHLRDVAWAEDVYGQIAEVYRNWKPTAAQLCYYFPKTVHANVVKLKDKEPHREVKVRHVCVQSEIYGDKFKHPWTSLFIDVENDHILEERGSWTSIYTIPRWATLAGSAYSYSPAALIALPDARLLQAMTLTLLDAGERAANPPMIGVAEAIRSDLQVFAGGFTSVDAEYDERLGEVLRPLTQDKSGLPYGFEMADRINSMLREAFYLNTLSMPPVGGPQMTAFEVGQRVQEYIRNALPLFEPMEDEYNSALCDITFETLMRQGAFGPPDTIPKAIRGGEIQFRFESPLADMIEREKGQAFLEAKAMIAEATSIDQTAPLIMDFKETLRDVLSGIGTPTKWLRSPEDVAAEIQKMEEQAQAAETLAAMQQGADVANTLGQASQAFQPPSPVI